MSDQKPAAKTSPIAQARRCQRCDSRVSLGSLDNPATFRGFTPHDLISGLHGVCVVLDSAIVDGNEFESPESTLGDLAMAAKVLSSILRTAVYS